MKGKDFMIIFYILFAVIILFIFINTILERKNTEYGMTFIAGEIGAGKTTYGVKLAQEHLKQGWTVYSTDYIDGCNQITVDELINHCAPEKSLIIIDEAALHLNSRNFAKTSMQLIEYFKLSRHFKNKVVFMSQTFTDTDKQIRDLATHVYFVRKVINGVLSIPVKVRAKLGIGQDGQPAMQYRIGHFGKPLFLTKYRKYYCSFGDVVRPCVSARPWTAENIVEPA